MTKALTQTMYRALLAILLLSLSLLLPACEANLAPDGSTITTLPTDYNLEDLGVLGDRTFVVIFAELTDVDGNPIGGVDIDVSTLFLRFLDNTGAYVDSPATFTTDDNGRIMVRVETAYDIEYKDNVFFQSGTASASVAITASAPSESS